MKAAAQAPRALYPKKEKLPSQLSDWSTYLTLIAVCFGGGYLLAYVLRDTLFTTGSNGEHLSADPRHLSSSNIAANEDRDRPDGRTVHVVHTSSGDAYQNYQTRILYASYKLVKAMPGGELMTGFTRILHRTVPDILMDEVPTFHVWNPLKPQCDGWCDYPVANRPNAIRQYFNAVAKNRSMITGAWVLMIECDYIFMKPFQAPGSAYDPNVPGLQYHYDYIMPQHPNAVPHIQKLYGAGKNISEVPASGPAPVLLRLHEWQNVVPDYEDASRRMEADEPMKKALEWVREMYAWDVAIADHKEIKVLTQKPPDSPLIVQPPFDVGMGNASMCHYTWGALYHENGKQIYRWEKRDFTEMKHLLKIKNIPMPPPFKPGLRLEFDAELTLPRHELVVIYLTQMNKAIDTLSDLTEYSKSLDAKVEAFRKWRTEQLSKKLVTDKVKVVPWSPPTKGEAAAAATGAAAAGKSGVRRLAA